MAGASISGLVSGLDSATIVSKLIQVESNPQTLLKNRQSSEKLAVSALQTVNAKIASLATKAGALSLAAAWNPLKATSSSSSVTVTVGTGASPGTTSFTVDQTARAHRVDFGTTAALDARVTGDGTTLVTLDRLDGTTTQIDTGDGTLSGLVKAINGSSSGLRASTVKLDDGTYRLSVVSTATGEDSDFTLTRADGSALLGTVTATAGRDARITVGPDQVSSSTNTFAGTLLGLDVTIAAGTAVGTQVDVSVTSDVASMTAQVKAMVDGANSVLADIDSLTSYNATTKASGALAGNATVRALRNELLDTVSRSADGQTLATVGVQVDRSGRLSFDEAKFTAAYAADPVAVSDRFVSKATYTGSGDVATIASSWKTSPGSYAIESGGGTATVDGVAATVSNTVFSAATGTRAEGLTFTASDPASGTLVFTQGLAARLASVASRASDATDGTVTGSIKNRTSAIDDLGEQITGWDVRLAARKVSLERQYAALEVALGKLNNQSSWLSGQIAQLSSSSS
ncbi:MAG: flagellar filament capping protein FliD [Nocardioidaceae bacterium]|nr:flagellar filament capping protein FliD [Nocardioidaceae bacterium]